MTSPASVSQESQEWEIPTVPVWSYWLLFGGLLAVGIGRSVTLAVLAPIGRELGLLEIQIGAISTCTAIMFFFGGPFWGRRSEKMGRRPVMVIGFLGYGATTIAFAQVVEWGLTGTVTLLLIYPLMILTRVAFAALSSGVFPAAQAFVTTTTKVEDRTSGIALNSAAFGLGSILGPALGGILVYISLLAPLYVAARSVRPWCREYPENRSRQPDALWPWYRRRKSRPAIAGGCADRKTAMAWASL